LKFPPCFEKGQKSRHGGIITKQNQRSKSRQGIFSEKGVFGRKNLIWKPKTQIFGQLDSASDLWSIWKMQTKPDFQSLSQVVGLRQPKQFAIIYKKSVSGSLPSDPPNGNQ
jgi:hypothetical protein